MLYTVMRLRLHAVSRVAAHRKPLQPHASPMLPSLSSPLKIRSSLLLRAGSAARALLLASLAGGALLAGPPAMAPAMAQDNNLFGNLFKPPGAAQNDAATNAAAEATMRLDRMENALRQLTGQIEELQYRNQQLEAQVKRLQEEGGGRPGAAPAASATPPAAIPSSGGTTRPLPATSGRRSDAFDPGVDPAAPGAPQPLGSPASASAGLAHPNAAVTPTGASAGTQVAALPAAGAPRELYDAGQAQIQRQDFAGAEQTFRQIIQANPGDRLIPDATFMLGESLFLRHNYGDAAAQFLEVSTKYPNSTRAPESLLRLGQSLAGLGEKETACATFLEVDRKYPRAASSIRQAVEREQKRVGC